MRNPATCTSSTWRRQRPRPFHRAWRLRPARRLPHRPAGDRGAAGADAAHAARLGCVATGDLSRMDVALAGRRRHRGATLTLRGESVRAGSCARAARRSTPALLARCATRLATPLALRLEADGIGGDADLHGRVRAGRFQRDRAALEGAASSSRCWSAAAVAARVRWPGRRCAVAPISARTAVARIQLAINARGLRWAGKPAPRRRRTPTPAIVADADFGFAGTRTPGRRSVRPRSSRDGERATCSFDGRGNARRWRPHPAGADADRRAGRARRHCVGAEAALGFDATLAGFDPGLFRTRLGRRGQRHAGDARHRARLQVAAEHARRGSMRHAGGEARQRRWSAVNQRGRSRRRAARTPPGAPRSRGDAYRRRCRTALGNSRVDARGTVADSSTSTQTCSRCNSTTCCPRPAARCAARCG